MPVWTVYNRGAQLQFTDDTLKVQYTDKKQCRLLATKAGKGQLSGSKLTLVIVHRRFLYPGLLLVN